MKKMGDMQLSTVTDTKKRKTILEQVQSRGYRHTVGTMRLLISHALCVCDANMNLVGCSLM